MRKTAQFKGLPPAARNAGVNFGIDRMLSVLQAPRNTDAIDYAQFGMLICIAVIGSLIASLLYYLGNSFSVSSIVGLSSRKSAFRIWHDNFLYTAPSFVLAGFLASLVAQFAHSFHVTVLLVVVPILYLCYYSYQVYLRSLENEKKHSSEMADLFNSTLS